MQNCMRSKVCLVNVINFVSKLVKKKSASAISINVKVKILGKFFFYMKIDSLKTSFKMICSFPSQVNVLFCYKDV